MEVIVFPLRANRRQKKIERLEAESSGRLKLVMHLQGILNSICGKLGMDLCACHRDLIEGAIQGLQDENRNLKHVNQGLHNFIEGLQDTNRRLLAVNAEYKGQAIRYANEIEEWETECAKCQADEVQTELEVKDGVLLGLEGPGQFRTELKCQE
jgi:hypothetical protein